nr:hypothetical protein [Carrot red leaf luteovirus associated RNA]AJM87504.1 hypothetical protein [Carrot red leaf luteovirus associated RNA]
MDRLNDEKSLSCRQRRSPLQG